MRIVQVLILMFICALAVAFVGAAQNATAQDTKFVRAPSNTFKFNCDFRRTAPIDPIVYPGTYGKSHRHLFFGGKVTKDSTYQQLRQADTTCTKEFHKTGYWVPALRRNGEEIPVRDAIAYYRATEGTPTVDLQPLARGNPQGRSMASWTGAAVVPAAAPEMGEIADTLRR